MICKGDDMEYTILNCDDLDGIIEDVNQHIKDGWKPLGGIAVVSHWDPALEVDWQNPCVLYFQSMTKE